MGKNTFRHYLWHELSREWLRFVAIEGAAGVICLVGVGLSTSGHRPEWMPDWSPVASFVGAFILGLALHVFCGFFFAWGRFIEDQVASFQTSVLALKEDVASNFRLIQEQLRLPTGLSNNALATLSNYLLDADKLYSVVYVRPSLWLRLGDLINVFSLQAYYRHRRLELKRPSVMIRFLIWNRDQFESAAGIFIIRASVLTGASTKIITRTNLYEVIRKYGSPVLRKLVDANLHVWLDCKIVDGEERPQSGRYGALTDQGFAEPKSMEADSEADESQHNFFELIKLLEEFSIEITAKVPDQIEEANLRDRIQRALQRMKTEREA